ncbi:MAG: tetratricopeptide repeat protein [Ferruginibacter sp.]
MNRIKAGIWLFAALITVSMVKAQSIDDGKKFLYYEKYKSAQSVFQKLVNADPNNAEAVYWLGQTYLRNADNPDTVAAKSLYQKAVMASNNNPLLLVAMGQIELMENKTQEARNHFETAISLTQGKNIAVLNAIGFANTNAKAGDASYAIDKLKQATLVKGFKDADVYLNLGDAYRKFSNDGAEPVKAYQAALVIDPNNAKALYRIGKVYQSQGKIQEDLFLNYYSQAVAKDPGFTPVYYNLYDYYYETNAPKAAENLDKYLTAMGSDEPRECYLRASSLFTVGKFSEVITKANECMSSGGTEPYVKLYALKGYAYMRLLDSNNAKTSFDTYFKKQHVDLITAKDVSVYIALLLRDPHADTTIIPGLVDRALKMDTTEVGKVDLLKTMAVHYENAKQYKDAADWYKKVLSVKKTPSKTDVFNAGYNYFKADDYTDAITVWDIYTTDFPSDILGFDMKGRSQRSIDSTLQNGLANESFQKSVDIGEAAWGTDSVRVKTALMRAYKYFIEYSYNVKKDKQAAIMWADKVLAKDPNDVEVQNYKKAFSAPTPPARPTPPRLGSTRPTTPPATPKTGGNGTAPKKK